MLTRSNLNSTVLVNDIIWKVFLVFVDDLIAICCYDDATNQNDAKHQTPK